MRPISRTSGASGGCLAYRGTGEVDKDSKPQAGWAELDVRALVDRPSRLPLSAASDISLATSYSCNNGTDRRIGGGSR